MNGEPDVLAGNACGRAHALTVITPVTWWWSLALRVQFAVRRRLPARLAASAAGPLERLSFIHFARWALVRRLPGDQPRLRDDLLLFESNFNGTWERYIDAFSYVIPSRMRMIWQGSRGFPGPLPATPFKAYIRRSDLEASHYYSAYPDATTTTIAAALTLHERLAALVDDAERLDADAFAARYREFLAEVQRCL